MLRTGNEVAVVTLTNWHLYLVIAAPEIPAQLLQLLFGFVVFFFLNPNKLVLKENKPKLKVV